MSDVVERAKAALEGVTEGPWTWTHGMDARAMVLGPDNLRVKLEGYRDAEFIAQARTLVPELVAEVERLRPRVIETVEELDSLPTLSIVRDEWTSAVGWQHSGIWERRGMEWHCIAAPVIPPGHPRPNLPARVLYTPEGDK
ncbi:hypothetical protein PBI_HOMINES_52 [Mycobacterium phage Homines]|nr:hypothetical protein PBI_HOMINES_52 [Mycobacterium phage Homines]